MGNYSTTSYNKTRDKLTIKAQLPAILLIFSTTIQRFSHEYEDIH